MSGEYGSIRTALLETASSERLPPLREDEQPALWRRSIGRSQTQVHHRPGEYTALGEDDRNDSIFMRKLYPKGKVRSYTFMERFRDAANAFSPTSTHTESHAIAFADSSQLDEQTTGHDFKFSAISEWSESGHVNHGSDIQGCLHASMLRSRSLAKQKADSMGHKLQHAQVSFEIFFTVACLIAAGALYYTDHERKDRSHPLFPLYGIPLFSWLILAALIFPTIRFARWAVDVIVTLLEAAAVRAGMNNVHYVLIGLSDALRLLNIAVLVWLLIVVIMHERRYDVPDKNLAILRNIGLCLVIMALVDLFKTLSCRLLSLRVNAEALFETLQEAIEKEHVLGRVMDRRPPAAGVSEADRNAEIARIRNIPEWSVPHYLSDLYRLSLSSDSRVLQVSSFTDRITALMAQFKEMPEPELDEHAAHAAEYCWLTVRRDLTVDKLFKEDLAAVLNDEEDADFTFSLFDLDGDGYVTEPEVHSRFQHIYRERRNLARTLQDNDSVIQSLEALVGACMHVLAIFGYAWIFGTDVGHLVISLSSMGLAFAFVFGNSLRTVYESVVFLFIIRPYQVGDAIIYKDKTHLVKNFGLLSTQFIRCDGCMIWVPNQTLMGSDINNVSQSQEMQDRISFEVDATNFKPEFCDDLAERVSKMMEFDQHLHLFSQDFVPFSYILAVKDPLKYQVGLCYQLAFNAEKFSKVSEARTLVNHVIGEWQRAHKVMHSTSVQPLYNYTGSS